jgi:protein-L-isoaspartate(D-aspartate) O-methyltransferase
MDDAADRAAARAAMVEEQLAARGILDARVLDAMRRVPRDQFVPAGVRAHAYDDRALPIGGGQTISQPYIVALMTEALAIGADDRVLDVGTGSGYQAAILGELASAVITIERRPDLAREARARLGARGYTNVTVIVGDGSLGFPERSPYDAMLVAAAAPRVPDALLAQLSDGGRLAIPVGPLGHQVLTLVRRTGGSFQEAGRAGCVFVPLIGAGGFADDVRG